MKPPHASTGSMCWGGARITLDIFVPGCKCMKMKLYKGHTNVSLFTHIYVWIGPTLETSLLLLFALVPTPTSTPSISAQPSLEPTISFAPSSLPSSSPSQTPSAQVSTQVDPHKSCVVTWNLLTLNLINCILALVTSQRISLDDSF